ncbi:MAG: hypothetical protein HY683_04210 [Chloroflexi bacterium]|nr:hypothetical protein [Chloroflexota bacterium]
MRWRAFRVVYQARSPIHVGYRTLGFIQRTRYYVPARALWGAFTAQLTRAYATYNDYAQVGKDVSSALRFSYLYPALDRERPLLPQFGPQGVFYGADPDGWTEGEFERRLVRSYGQTAIEPQSNTAEDATLRETEYLAPFASHERGAATPVFYVGYVMVNDKARIAGLDLSSPRDIERFRAAVTELFVGGERKYGFGRLTLAQDGWEELTQPQPELFTHRLDLRAGSPSITVLEGQPIPAHLAMNGDRNLRGDVELLAGRLWNDKKGAGQEPDSNGLCWVPGSIIAACRARLSIGEKGILGSVDIVRSP